MCGIWYRAKNDKEAIAAFEREWALHSRNAIGSIIIGDLNIHHKKWLHHSSENSADGEILQSFCQSYGFSQLVKAPTRSFIESNGVLKEYKLDLALCDLPTVTKCTILPQIADHKLVLVTVNASVPTEVVIPRKCWAFAKCTLEEN